MNIDWSKAPEGATRYHPETSKIIEHWLKMVGDEEWIWTSHGKRWMPHIDAVEDSDYHDRPAPEWSGEGLPPVGTVCEYRWGSVCKQVEIIAHWMAPADLVAVYVPLEDGVHSTECGRAIANAFRPLRTPEQIAADERLHKIRNAFTAISKAIAPFQGPCGSEAAIRVTVEAMIDAGYLKSEGGAA